MSAESYLSILRGSKGFPGQENDKPKKINRFMGGTKRYNHPMISGYFYTIVEPPTRIFAGTARPTTEFLISCCESFTPPSRSIEKGEVPGFGGIKVYTPTTTSISGSFTLTFKEYFNSPVFQSIHLWASMIQPHFGVFSMDKCNFSDYKGSVTVLVNKPTSSGSEDVVTIDEKCIEQVFHFVGVFPENSPYDAFNSDIASNDLITISVNFAFDGAPLTKENFSLSEAIGKIKSYEVSHSQMSSDKSIYKL